MLKASQAARKLEVELGKRQIINVKIITGSTEDVMEEE